MTGTGGFVTVLHVQGLAPRQIETADTDATNLGAAITSESKRQADDRTAF